MNETLDAVAEVIAVKKPDRRPKAHANGDTAAAKRSKLIAERIAVIEKRFALGEPLSRADKKLANLPVENTEGTVNGYGGVIGHIFKHHGVTLLKTSLSAWTRGNSLPVGCHEPFPACEPPNRYRIETFMAWVVKHIPKPSETAKNGKANGEITDYVGERHRIAMLREKKQLLWAEQENDVKYVLRSDSESALDTVVQKLRSFIRNAWRRQLNADTQTELRKRGFTDAQLATVAEVYAEVGKTIIRNIEDQCEKA